MLFTFSAADTLRCEGRLTGQTDGLGKTEACLGLSFRGHRVIATENAGDIDALRAGHAIAAGGAADLFTGADQGFYLIQKDEIRLSQRSGKCCAGGFDIFIDHFHRIHTGKNDGDLRLVEEPAESPPGGGPAPAAFRHAFFRLRGEKTDQLSAPQGLHDHDGNAPGGSSLQPFDAGLGGFVEIVILDLAEIPVVILQNFQEVLRVSVEGEADVPDGAGGLFSEIQERMPICFRRSHWAMSVSMCMR